MDNFERWNKYKFVSLDKVIVAIKHGQITCGKYANKIKVGKPPKEVKGWWLENDEHSNDSRSDESRKNKSKSNESGQNKENHKSVSDSK